MPIIPSKEQYIDVIKKGDDSIHKKVVLHTNGIFEVVPNDIFDIESDYVGRSETLDAGNGYVGIEASEDEGYINDSYTMFLKAWLDYIKTGAKRKYLDLYGYEKEEDLLEQIKSLSE